MDSITICCTVTVADAIQGGYARAGAYDHNLTDAEAQALVREHLSEIVKPYLAAPGMPAASRLKVGAPVWDSILGALRLQNERAGDTRRRIRMEREFLAEWGADNQHERHVWDVLSEEEMLDTARRVAFAKFDELFTRFGKKFRRPALVAHANDCPHIGLSRDAMDAIIERAMIDEHGALNSEQWKEFRHICRIVSDRNQDAPIAVGFTQYDATLRTHHMKCPSCGSVATHETVLVTITWCGRPLSREYLLAR